MTKEAKKPEPGTGWEVGVDRYRDATKWVIAAFGSIGALIVAAVPIARLSDGEVGSLSLVTTGVAVAVAGALLAVLAALWNLAPQAIYPGDVNAASRTWIKRWLWGHARLEHRLYSAPRSLLPTSINHLDELEPAIEGLERLAARQAVLGVTTPTMKEASKASYQRLAALRRTRRQLHGLARFERARTRFRASLSILVVAAITTVAGLGVATYGLIDSPDQPTVQLSDQTPTSVSIILTPAGVETLASRLGDDCVDDDIAALVLAGDTAGDAWEVVTLETASCPAARFTLTAVLGTIS